jgi:hypothetical protein
LSFFKCRAFHVPSESVDKDLPEWTIYEFYLYSLIVDADIGIAKCQTGFNIGASWMPDVNGR